MKGNKKQSNDDEIQIPGGGDSQMIISRDVKDPEVWKHAVRYQFIYSILGLALGLCCIIGGIILFLNGITGNTDWTLKLLGNESIINDAGAGVVLFIVGLFVVLVTRYNVKPSKK